MASNRFRNRPSSLRNQKLGAAGWVQDLPWRIEPQNVEDRGHHVLWVVQQRRVDDTNNNLTDVLTSIVTGS
jgi:hypothetical protein